MGHQAVEAPLKSFRYMFLIHQAFQPPVFCLILQSSVLQYSILQCPSSYPPVLQYPRKQCSRLTARPPLAKKPHKRPSTGCYFPSWGWIFSDPSRILCIGVSKTHSKMHSCDFYPRKTQHSGSSNGKNTF